MADPTPPAGPAEAELSGATTADNPPVAPDETAPDLPPSLMTAGAPGWYSLVATSFLVCEFNPIGALGLAAGVGSAPGNPLGWALTVASFMLALSGFIYAEWRASVDGNQRALEIGSVIAIAAGIVPCISAISIPALIAWPIGMMFLVTGGSGLRAARKLAFGTPLAVTESAGTGGTLAMETQSEPAEAAPKPVTSDQPLMGENSTKRRRKRRRSRNRKPRSPQ